MDWSLFAVALGLGAVIGLAFGLWRGYVIGRQAGIEIGRLKERAER